MHNAAGPQGPVAAGDPLPAHIGPGLHVPDGPPTTVLTEFFRHHGIWAPGVRLFRRMRFVAKAGIVSAFFLLPLLALSFAYFTQASSAIATSKRERLGVTYLRDAASLLHLAQRQRLLAVQTPPPPELAPLRDEIAAQVGRLKAVDARLGASLDMGTVLSASMQAYQAVLDKPSSSVAHAQFAASLLDLLDQVSDRSNLAVDPGIDTVYLMTNVVTNLPLMVEMMARQVVLQTAVAAEGRGVNAAELRLMDVTGAMATQSSNRVKNEFAKVYASHADYRAVFRDDEVRDKAEAVRQLEGADPETLKTVTALGGEAMRASWALQKLATDRLETLLDARIRSTSLWREGAAVLVAGSVLLAAYLFFAFYLVTQGGLREVEKHLQAMTSGDLTTRPNPWGRDEAAGLMTSLAQMQGSLRGIVTRVRGASTAIVLSSGEIASASQDLSERTEQTATNLQESAAAVEQIAATAKQTASHSEHAATTASENSAAASKGGLAITEAIETMQNIHASSSKIGDIIGTIDGIAFQTNILALNAAVEAARAGEHGRGFAVVAAEVRTLAQRSAAAARQIKTLVTDSMNCVDSGSRTVSSAGDTMASLVETAQTTKNLLADISVAAAQQSHGVSQVGVAVHHLEEMTQQNATLVEQTAASAAALNQQALHLADEVARFKLPA